jgi:hypothetical protein
VVSCSVNLHGVLQMRENSKNIHKNEYDPAEMKRYADAARHIEDHCTAPANR